MCHISGHCAESGPRPPTVSGCDMLSLFDTKLSICIRQVKVNRLLENSWEYHRYGWCYFFFIWLISSTHKEPAFWLLLTDWVLCTALLFGPNQQWGKHLINSIGNLANNCCCKPLVSWAKQQQYMFKYVYLKRKKILLHFLGVRSKHELYIRHRSK